VILNLPKSYKKDTNDQAKLMVLGPTYKPLQVSKCEKCGGVIAEPRELIRIKRE